jgi:hypothetical protein
MATVAMETVTAELVCRSERCGAWRHMISGWQIPSEWQCAHIVVCLVVQQWIQSQHVVWFCSSCHPLQRPVSNRECWQVCPVDCHVSPWSEWSACPQQCVPGEWKASTCTMSAGVLPISSRVWRISANKVSRIEVQSVGIVRMRTQAMEFSLGLGLKLTRQLL